MHALDTREADIRARLTGLQSEREQIRVQLLNPVEAEIFSLTAELEALEEIRLLEEKAERIRKGLVQRVASNSKRAKSVTTPEKLLSSLTSDEKKDFLAALLAAMNAE